MRDQPWITSVTEELTVTTGKDVSMMVVATYSEADSLVTATVVTSERSTLQSRRTDTRYVKIVA